MNLDVITRKTYLHIVEPWLDWVERRECGFTFFDGRAIYRLRQFEQDTKLHELRWGERGLRVGIIDIESGMIDNNEQLAKYLGRYFGIKVDSCDDLEQLMARWKREGMRVLLFVIPAERLLDEKRGIYHYLAYLHETYQVSVILHFQTNVFDKRFYENLSHKTCFIQNHSFNPIYPREDQIKFCEVMCEEWGKRNISRADMDTICDASGDHMLLVKQCLRVMLFQNMSAGKSIRHQSVMEKVNVLYESFDEGLQQVLRDLVKKRTGVDEKGLSFLLEMGFVKQIDSELKLRIPLMEDLLKEKLIELTRLRVVDGEVLAGEVNLDAQLSVQEKRILEILLKNRGAVVSREIIAEIMWGKEVIKKYSDWAIDKMMSRLRKKIATIGSEDIKTVKGRGFSFQ